MNLSTLEQHVFAYYVATSAKTLEMVPRAWPHGELLMIIEDKIRVAIRPFGARVSAAATNVAREFLEVMTEAQGFSTINGAFGSIMHKYQGPDYRACLERLQRENTIVAEANAAGADFWKASFERLVG